MPTKVKRYLFTVSGYGDFPIDMLRYDRCWPASETDSGRMYGRDKREVVLRGLNLPTVARWNSFMWNVIKQVEENF